VRVFIEVARTLRALGKARCSCAILRASARWFVPRPITFASIPRAEDISGRAEERSAVIRPFEVGRAWRRVIAAVLLCLIGREGFALTTQEAGENILYFEHARLSSEVCEREGTPARAAYEAWLSKNSLLQRNSVETLRTAAAERGLSPAEQSDLVAEGLRSVTARAQEHITSHGVQCRRFAGLLEMYSKLLKR